MAVMCFPGKADKQCAREQLTVVASESRVDLRGLGYKGAETRDTEIGTQGESE
jgi:hypothetical protein